jgi:hypothetical protein
MPSQSPRKTRPVVAAASEAALGPRFGVERRRYVDCLGRADELVPRLVERVELPRAGVRAAMIPEATRDAAGHLGAARD